MYESVACGLHYGLHSILMSCIIVIYYMMKVYRKQIIKKYMYRCIGGMMCCISKLYNLNLMFRHYFALLMTINEFLNLLFGTARLSSSVH